MTTAPGSQDSPIDDEWPNDEVIDTWGRGTSPESQYASQILVDQLHMHLFPGSDNAIAAVNLDRTITEIAETIEPRIRPYVAIYLQMLRIPESRRDAMYYEVMPKLLKALGPLSAPLMRAHRLFNDWNSFQFPDVASLLNIVNASLDENTDLFVPFFDADAIMDRYHDLSRADNVTRELERIAEG